jgi:CheY-like chemotaxis protein
MVIEDAVADILALQLYLDLSGQQFQLETLTDSVGLRRSIDEYRQGSRGADPCVILLDLDLQRTSGIDLLAAIKQESVLENIHLIALTQDEKWRAEAEKLGAVCREKPETLGEIQSLAAEIVKICQPSQ